MQISEKVLRKVEWGVVIAITVLIIGLHFIFLCHRGPLWRDEAGAINLAEMPTLGGVWKNLYYDSFPIFWVWVARAWWWLGFGSDFGFRVLGFLTGLLVLAALWFTARSFRLRFPVFSLLLAGLSPLLIVYGDTMRAWGWGVLWLVLLFGLVWRVVQSPTRRNLICAALSAVAAVQTTYYNSVFVFAVCTAGFLVLWRRKLWRRGLLVLGIGALAAFTMLPYLKFIMMGESHYAVLRRYFGWPQFTDKLEAALSGMDVFNHDLLDLRVWWSLLIIAPCVMMICQFVRKLQVSDERKDLALFGLLAMILGTSAFYLFLHKLSFVTSGWYYIPLLVLGALGLEAIFSVAEAGERGRLFRLVVVIVLLFYVPPPLEGVIKLRMTNLDLIADRITHSASPKDLILVNPYFFGISFGHYYSGDTPWMTVPVVDTRVHRYDTIKELVSRQDQKAVVQDVLDRVRHTLKNGGDVWVVYDNFPIESTDVEPRSPHYRRKPNLSITLNMMGYWAEETAFFLREHSLRQERLRVTAEDPVNFFELGHLMKVSGWRDSAPVNTNVPPVISSRSR